MPRSNISKSPKTTANSVGTKKPAKTPIQAIVALLKALGPFLVGLLGAIGAFLLVLNQIGVFSKPTTTPTPILPLASATATYLPTNDSFTASPKPSSTPEMVVSATPFPTSDSQNCSWIAFLNGEAIPNLSSEECLNDLKSNGIFGNEKRISFFVDGSARGMYGICQDISEKEKVEFEVEVRDNLDSARFLVTVGPEPIPNKLAYGMRIQPEIQPKQEKEMYVKFIRYTLGGIDNELDKIKALKIWKDVNNWDFDFIFRFSGSKVNGSMNQALMKEWQLTSAKQYLCFAYQAMPTAIQPAHLEVQVEFR
jgi:hypothetical protein